MDGAAVTTTELLSHSGILLAFFKVTCPVCQYTLPFLDRIHREASGASIRIFGVSQNSLDDTREFNKEFDIHFAPLIDNEGSFEVSNLFGISMVPSMFLIGQDRTVEWVSQGFSRRDLETLGLRMGAQVFRNGEQVPDFRPG